MLFGCSLIAGHGRTAHRAARTRPTDEPHTPLRGRRLHHRRHPCHWIAP